MSETYELDGYIIVFVQAIEGQWTFSLSDPTGELIQTEGTFHGTDKFNSGAMAAAIEAVDWYIEYEHHEKQKLSPT